MAGKKQTFDNTELKELLKGYQYLNQLTQDGLDIINQSIAVEFEGTTSKFGGDKKEVLRLLIMLTSIDYTTVEQVINARRVLRGEKKLGKSMLYHYRNIAIRASTNLLEAHGKGIQIVNPISTDARNLKPYEKEKIRKMINNNVSLETLKAYVNSL